MSWLGKIPAAIVVSGQQLANGTVSAIKLAAGAVASHLGYTPANKAGDTFTGDIVLDNGLADGPQVILKSQGNNFWAIDNYNGRLRAYNNTTEYLNVDTSGNLNLTAGNLVVPNGKGIDFSAGGNASGMTSELLDDYEHGLWTPSFTIGGNPAGTWVTKYGKYVKVGNMVTVWAYLYTTSGRGSGTGPVRIEGLPFAMGILNGGHYHIADCRAGVSWSSGGAGLPFHYLPDGASYLLFYQTSNSTTSGTSQMAEANFNPSGTIELNVMLSYNTF